MKLHITNLSPKVTAEELQELFHQYGEVFSIEITWDKRLGRNTGSALIEMNPLPALTAVRELNGRAFRSRRLYITPLEQIAKSGKPN